MQPTYRFRVEPEIPTTLDQLPRLARNLRWTWDQPTRAVFERLDADAWRRSEHDPIRQLELISAERWAAITADADLVAAVQRQVAALDDEIAAPRWFQERTSPLELVAYFSPEFGISETLPQYSGGLGVLAGDHLKAASDLGIPLVGIGLLYREGYFRQSLVADGWQSERFPPQDTGALAVTNTGKQISLEVGGEHVAVAIWRVDVGSVPLYLLDTSLPGNSPDAAAITDRLYGGDEEHRLRQEIVLGIGGVRALRALGLSPQVFHTNEGHAGFLSLERIREHVANGVEFATAIELVRSGGVFTTHTPVPAGIDRFPDELLQRYFTGFAAQCGVGLDQLRAFGHRADEPGETRFNMAVMGLRLAARSNGVAALHGEVSQSMFQGLWPDAPVDEVPITSITNGVHAHTWVAPRVADLLTAHVHPVWDGADAKAWDAAHKMDAHAIWAARNAGRAELVEFVHDRLGTRLDPDALTIGFARRFATYKRATLLLSQADRLSALLGAAGRPVQFVFAGKAHPADHPGKEMIQAINRFGHSLAGRGRFVFVPDYDMAVARTMYHGADVWLNTPRRPQEACGTSGMKAALNGALNCSILDGWWDEAFDGSNGWAIRSEESELDQHRRDEQEATDLFWLLEHEIVPLFYDRTHGIPHGWLDRVRHAWATIGPVFTASRMVREYTERLYEPAAASSTALLADGGRPARELADWKQHVAAVWPSVAITEAEQGPDTVRLTVATGGLRSGELRAQVVHGPVDAHGAFRSVTIEDLSLESDHDGVARFAGAFRPVAAGAYGCTARVLPHHADLASPLELGLARYVTVR